MPIVCSSNLADSGTTASPRECHCFDACYHCTVCAGANRRLGKPTKFIAISNTLTILTPCVFAAKHARMLFNDWC